MKKLFKVAVISLLLTATISSCSEDEIVGQGAIIVKELALAPIASVDMRIAGNVTLLQGDNQTITVTGRNNIIDRLTTRVINGSWDISLGKGKYTYDRLEIVIVVPNIQDIILSGSGTILIEDFVDQGNMKLSLSGSGNITIQNIEGPETLDVDIKGSGSIDIDGLFAEVSQMSVDISGSGNLDGYNVSSKNCVVNISGSGSSKIMVEDHLDVNITGSGVVYYKGQPDISTDITGSGRVVNSN